MYYTYEYKNECLKLYKQKMSSYAYWNQAGFIT